MIEVIKKKKFIIISFFILYLFIGLLIFQDYGLSWDEPISRINGFVTLNYIYDLLNIQTIKGYENIKIYRDNYYGVVFDLPVAFIENIFFNNNSKSFYLLRHFSTFLIFYISSICFYLICKKFYSFQICLIGVLLYITMPRIFAESFYNNKDVVFLAFFTITNYYFIIFIQNKNFINLLKFSIVVGLLIGTRIIGIIIPIFVIFFLILDSLDKNFFRSLILSIKFIILVLIFTYLFWPYLWSNPIENFLFALNQMKNFQWSGSVFYLGNYEVGKFMPWHYSLIMMISTIPLVYVIFFVIGFLFILKDISLNFINLKKSNGHVWKNNLQFFNQFCFFIITITILSIVEFNSTIYTGWRQIYFLYLPISIISLNAINILNNKYNLISKILLPFYILIIIFWIFQNHPYQYVYYNFPFSKIAKKNFELDYWGVSNLDMLKFLLKKYNLNEYKIYSYSISPYQQSTLLLNDIDKKKFKFTNNIKDADFIISNHYYQEETDPYKMRLFLNKNYRTLHEIKVNNIAINTLYEKRK